MSIVANSALQRKRIREQHPEQHFPAINLVTATCMHKSISRKNNEN